jgi:hypothetical protein
MSAECSVVRPHTFGGCDIVRKAAASPGVFAGGLSGARWLPPLAGRARHSDRVRTGFRLGTLVERSVGRRDHLHHEGGSLGGRAVAFVRARE